MKKTPTIKEAAWAVLAEIAANKYGPCSVCGTDPCQPDAPCAQLRDALTRLTRDREETEHAARDVLDALDDAVASGLITPETLAANDLGDAAHALANAVGLGLCPACGRDGDAHDNRQSPPACPIPPDAPETEDARETDGPNVCPGCKVPCKVRRCR